MSFCRGHRSSYDAWGVPGWGFNDLLFFFKRSEHAMNRDPALRGVDGPLIVGPADQPHPVAAAGLDAAAEAGFRRASDISGGMEEGFGWVDLSIAGGRRRSAVDGYMTSARDRDNLQFVADVLVNRVLISKSRCTGVEYVQDGETTVARCVDSGTVVLTAGTVGTPQVLMLSGIGPAAHLQEHGITVLVDLPAVGENVHDHPMSGIVYGSRQRVPDTVSSHGDVQGLIRSSASDVDGPDVQLMIVDVPLRDFSIPGPEIGHGYTVVAALMLPRSRGTIRLRNATPGAPTIIDPRYYADGRDIDAMAEGLRAARKIGRTDALAPWRELEAWPGADISDDVLAHCVTRNLRSYSHYAGSCRMGTDEGAVVDPSLKVRSIDGLRIADASIMPRPVSANTNATVYAIAEQAADLLRGG